MRFIRARLRGFCQHLDTEMEFGERLTVLRGPIGSGKTNAINGILYALTGDLSRIPGVKADNVCRSLGPREPAFVEVEFEHGGARATLRRGLRPAGQLLTVEGRERTWDKDREIRDELEDLLGVNDKILTGYVFVEQWKIFDFLLRTPGETADTFSQLFGLERARQIHALLGELKIEVPPAALDADSQRQLVGRWESVWADLDRQLAPLKYLPAKWNEWEDPDAKTIRDWQGLQALKVEAARDRGMVETAEVDFDRAADELAVAEAARAVVENDLRRSAEEAARAAQGLSVWDNYDRVSADRRRLDGALAEVCKALDELEPPVGPVMYVAADNAVWVEHHRGREARLRQLRSFLATFDPATGRGDCPTCMTPAADLRARYEGIRSQAEAMAFDFDRMQRAWDESRQYDGVAAEVTRRMLSLHDAARFFRQQLAALPVIEPPAGTRQQLDAAVVRHRAVADACRRASNECQRLVQISSSVRGRLDSIREQALVRARAIADCRITEADAAEAGSRLAMKRKDWSERLRVEAETRAASVALAAARESLARAELGERQRRQAARAAEMVSRVRGLFHHDSLPRKVSQAYLESMQGEINLVLEDFDAPFRVTDVQGLRFVVRKGSTVQPASRLSGGEKVLFAMAFRIVVNSLFARELGLLCLDEPTAGLDEDSLSCLDVALGRLRRLSESRGLQVILVTHERGLDRLFDKVIDLGRGGYHG